MKRLHTIVTSALPTLTDRLSEVVLGENVGEHIVSSHQHLIASFDA